MKAVSNGNNGTGTRKDMPTPMIHEEKASRRSLQQGTNDWPALSRPFPTGKHRQDPCLSHCMTGVGPGHTNHDLSSAPPENSGRCSRCIPVIASEKSANPEGERGPVRGGAEGLGGKQPATIIRPTIAQTHTKRIAGTVASKGEKTAVRTAIIKN